MKNMLKIIFVLVLCCGVIYSPPSYAGIKLDAASTVKKVLGTVNKVVSKVNDISQKVADKVIDIKTFAKGKTKLIRLPIFKRIEAQIKKAMEFVRLKSDLSKLLKEAETIEKGETEQQAHNDTELEATKTRLSERISEIDDYIAEHPDITEEELSQFSEMKKYEEEQLTMAEEEHERRKQVIEEDIARLKEENEAKQKALEEGLAAATPVTSEAEPSVEPEKIIEEYFIENSADIQGVQNVRLKRNQDSLKYNIFLIARALELQLPLLNGNVTIDSTINPAEDGEALQELKKIQATVEGNTDEFGGFDDQLHKISLKASMQLAVARVIVNYVEAAALEMLVDTYREISRLPTYSKSPLDYKEMDISRYAFSHVDIKMDTYDNVKNSFINVFLSYPEISQSDMDTYFTESSTLEARYDKKRQEFFEDTLMATNAVVQNILGFRSEGDEEMQSKNLKTLKADLDQMEAELAAGLENSSNKSAVTLITEGDNESEGPGGEGAEERIPAWRTLFLVYKQQDLALRLWEQLSIAKAQYVAAKSIRSVRPAGFNKVGATE